MSSNNDFFKQRGVGKEKKNIGSRFSENEINSGYENSSRNSNAFNNIESNDDFTIHSSERGITSSDTSQSEFARLDSSIQQENTSKSEETIQFQREKNNQDRNGSNNSPKSESVIYKDESNTHSHKSNTDTGNISSNSGVHTKGELLSDKNDTVLTESEKSEELSKEKFGSQSDQIKQNKESIRSGTDKSIATNSEGSGSAAQSTAASKPGITSSTGSTTQGIVNKNGNSTSGITSQNQNDINLKQSAYEKLSGKKLSERLSKTKDQKEKLKKESSSRKEDKNVRSKKNDESVRSSKDKKSDSIRFSKSSSDVSSFKTEAGPQKKLKAQSINKQISKRPSGFSEKITGAVSKISGKIKTTFSSISSHALPIATAGCIGATALTGATGMLEYIDMDSSTGHNTAIEYEDTNTFISIENCPVAYKIYKYFTNDLGYSDIITCAMIGNFFKESGGDGSSDINPSSAGMGGSGIAGFTGDDDFTNYVASQGANSGDWKVQCDYIDGCFKDPPLKGSHHWWIGSKSEQYLKDTGYLDKTYTHTEFLELDDLKIATACFLGYFEEGIRANTTYTIDGKYMTGEERADYEMGIRYSCAVAVYNAFTTGTASSYSSSTSSGLKWKNSNANNSNAKTYSSSSGITGSSIDYVDWAIKIANDDSHGYCQPHRNGDPDYDCSSLVSYALQSAGYNCGVFYTASEESVLVGLGFTKLPFSLDKCQPGDILWRNGHTGIYVCTQDGLHYTVEAHQNENDNDGWSDSHQAGDQTGNEINVSALENTGATFTYIYRPPS